MCTRDDGFPTTDDELVLRTMSLNGSHSCNGVADTERSNSLEYLCYVNASRYWRRERTYNRYRLHNLLEKSCIAIECVDLCACSSPIRREDLIRMILLKRMNGREIVERGGSFIYLLLINA